MKQNKIIIVGGGPAGIACSVQLARFGYNPLLIEKEKIGGLLRNANLVENYLGFPTGISGPALVSKFAKQLGELNVNLLKEKVVDVAFSEDRFTVKTNNNIYSSRFLVVATGTSPIELELEIPERLQSLIYYEIAGISDFDSKNIAIVGAGDAAFDYAINIAQNYNPKTVDIFNRSSRIKSLKLLVERAKNIPLINYNENKIVNKIISKNQKIALEFSCGLSKEYDILIPAIGRRANKKIIDNLNECECKKLIENKRLFLVGDVKNKAFRQASIAAGQGVQAAMEINKKNFDMFSELDL